MLSKCHQIFLTNKKIRLLCTPDWTCTCLSIKSQETLLILFLLPLFTLCCLCPGGLSPPLLKIQPQRLCVYFWPREDQWAVGWGMCKPQGGLCRVEKSKPDSFLSLLILGRNSAADLFPSWTSSGSDQGASQPSVFTTESHAQAPSLLFFSTQSPRPSTLHWVGEALTGTCLWDSLNKGLSLNQYSQMSKMWMFNKHLNT